MTAAKASTALFGAGAAGGIAGGGAVFLAKAAESFRPFGFGPDLLAKLDPVEHPTAETAAMIQPVMARDMNLRMENPHP